MVLLYFENSFFHDNIPDSLCGYIIYDGPHCYE